MDESIIAYEMDSISGNSDNDDEDKDNVKQESDEDENDDAYLAEDSDSDSDSDKPVVKRIRIKNNEHTIGHTCGWTTAEKKNLYNALVTYGSSNLVELAKCVPTKTPKVIKEFIANYEKLARSSLKDGKKVGVDRKAPIDKWLEYLKKSSNTDSYRHMDFARAFKYIALFEPKTISEDVKIGDCYEVISNLLRGDAPKYINQESSLFLLKNVQKLVGLKNETTHENESNFFNSLRPQKVIPKTYASMGKNAVTSTVHDAFLLDDVINPLSVPKNLLFHN